MILADNKQARLHAAAIIRSGGVIAFRTDTFYGLGADPFNAGAIKRITELKGREEGKPTLIVLSEQAHISRFIAKPSKIFACLAQHFWPGPLTLIGEAGPDVPKEITANSGTVGVRLPDDDEVRELISACGGALTATSANLSGQEPATSAQQAEEYFGSRIDLVLDCGPARSDRPSTVIETSGRVARLIRAGAILRAELDERLAECGFESL